MNDHAAYQHEKDHHDEQEEEKYAVVLGAGSAEHDVELMLMADERTLNVPAGVNPDKPTRIRITRMHRSQRWCVEASGGRYTVTLMAVRERAADRRKNR